ncbi:hypothetical protein C5167_047365 [Papaver somniferum]|uniref:Pre-mRNA-splicing factor SLU7 n=1 Tax=Papaver somniferum TaxID=3469 RepID=A0A4Y7LJC7_PAPSO|nr:hypothetical protein C5167_047365 [Papaver somniferum]
MASACRASMSRVDRRKQNDLEEGRKAGILPPETDKHGNTINPHIPKYMSQKPWYTENQDQADQGPSLDHQKKQQNLELRFQGACMERPRERKAKHTNMFIAPDEKIYQTTSSGELDYDSKRDRWNGYDFARYDHDTRMYEARDEARMKSQKGQQIKKLEDLSQDEAKVVDESQQRDFAKVEKRVRAVAARELLGT